MGFAHDVEKALRKGNAQAAVHALGRLPALEREPFLDPVGRLFRAAVQADHRASNWSQLASWASRAEKLPGLAGAHDSADFWATSWALTWGAIKTKDWVRAQRWYEPLHAFLTTRSADFATAMAALVTGQAQPAQVARFLEAGPAEDPRLGHDSKRVRVAWAVPSSLDDIEPTLLAMVAHESWGVFASTVTSWEPQVEPEGRRRMLELAGKLATRETLKRARAGRADFGAPAELLHFAVERLGPGAPLANEALVVFRLLAALPLKTDSAHGRALGQAALAASAFASTLPSVLAFFSSADVTVTPSLVKAMEPLLGKRPNAMLVGKSMLALSRADPKTSAHRPSQALIDALSAILASDPVGLARWVEDLDEPSRENWCGWSAYCLPIATAQALLLATWPHASKRARVDLVDLVLEVLARFHFESSGFSDEDPLDLPLPARARPFWNAVRDLVLPEDFTLLPFALREARDEDPLKLVRLALGARPAMPRILEAWDVLADAGLGRLCPALETELFSLHGHDLHALIHGLLDATSLRLPIALRRKLARALHDQRHQATNCSDRHRAFELAAKLLAPPKPRAKRKNKAPTPPAATKKTAKKRPPPENGSLPF